ncbi:WecB/TagA/CpsF family glycosyltransferase [Rugosimonospora acidiphila]|uniref:WecB/TagA/CpsF family glycosyltransferase n=1 Tax=Rugosimonospora acidiphila TaxID=556531 RepID=UPI0031EE237E
MVGDRLAGPRVPEPRSPLAIGSANLDHVHHFGSGGRSAPDIDVSGNSPEWLILLDGAPMVRHATRLTGREWPLLAGSDLLPELLDTAQAARSRVGFLGGSAQMHDLVRPVLADRYPELSVAGFWAPQRAELTDPAAAAGLAESVRLANVDLLVVGLGKPRQERWIQRHAAASGARVLLAFGAATDFLAGTASRAPGWVRHAGVEWLYRLSREPRRLTRRYCVQGPPAMWRLWTDSRREASGAR